MATEFAFTDDSGLTRFEGHLVPDPANTAPAVVLLAGVLSPWDGSALPFDTIRHDPDGLWNATSHQYVAATTGWYEVICSPSSASGGVTDTAAGGGVFAAVGGPGDNIGAGFGFPLDVGGSLWGFPPIVGVTRLRRGDTIDIEGTGTILSAGNLAFSLRLLGT